MEGLTELSRTFVPTSAILIENFHGAASRVPVDATAYALRESGYNTLVLGQWMDPTMGESTTSWCRETINALKPFVGARQYLNYLGPEEPDGAAAAYGSNLARLQRSYGGNWVTG